MAQLRQEYQQFVSRKAEILVVGPAAGGFLLGALGIRALGVIGALIMAWLIS